MSITQIRHMKLAWAGGLNNWALAAYEVDQMRKSFAATTKLYPTYQNIDLAKLIRDVSEPALKQIDDAIKAKDHNAAMRAFKNLTDACNSCHQQAGYGFVDIRVPTAFPFTNQSVTPK